MIWKRLEYLLPWRRRAFEREMQEELASLEAIAGRRELGNLTLAAEGARGAWGWTSVEGMARDLRYALRVLARRPSFTLMAVLSLGLGIGANAAIFSLMDALLWRQLPVREPDRLVTFGDSFSHYAFGEFRKQSSEVLTGVLATTRVGNRDLETAGAPFTGRVEIVSGNYFDLLGLTPVIGRNITPDDDRPSGGDVAVLSYAFWQSAFGGDRGAIGRQVRVTRLPFTIVGVARPEFFGLAVGEVADVWIPLAAHDRVTPGRKYLDNWNTNFLTLFGRLAPGVTPERASAVLTPISHAIDLTRGGPQLEEWIRKAIDAEVLRLTPAASGLSYLRKRFSQPLRVLLALVAIGLLLACINVMSLEFARADERRRELSLRLAIGAGRARVVRQLLAESAAVALAGGLLGLAICRPAAAALTGILSMGGSGVELPLRIDNNMLLFVAAISIVCALLCGVAPALRATGRDLSGGLQQASRSMTPAPARRLLTRLVAAVQVTLSVVLIAGAFLFAFSLYRLTSVHMGVDRRNLMLVDIDPAATGFKQARRSALEQAILDRLRAIPGVERVTYSENGILMGRNSNTQMGAEGFDAPKGSRRNAYFDRLGSQYFTTVGTRIVAGRDFEDRDDQSAPKVAIINESFAQHFFPGQNPLGRHIYRVGDTDTLQVVGVVEDIREDIRQPSRRYFFVPQKQTADDLYTTRYVVRSGKPLSATDLRAAIRSVGSTVSIVSVDSADDLFKRRLDLDRLLAALSFAFGVLAVTLAAVGIYGLMAYDVTRRTSEIGIRMALGATRGGVMGLLFRETAVVAVTGVIAGTLAALWLGQLVAGLVFQLEPGDPRVLAASVVLLITVAAGATWFPARRAASTDPMTALRHE